MQPSLALRTQALGRCWGGARRSMLHHVPQTAATPRTLLHTQDSEEDAKEGSLDAFVMKFQQILVAPKDWRAKHPSKKTSRMKGSRGAKDAKNPSPQSQISYQPFTFKSHSVPHSSEVCLKDELASLGKGEIVNEGMDDRLRMDGMKRRGLQRGMNDRERGKDRIEGKAGEREGMNNRKRLTERGKEGLGEKSGERERMNGVKKQQERKEEMRTGGRINKTKTEHKRKEKINQETDTEEEKGEEIKEEKEREQRTETIKTRKEKMNKNKKLNQEKHSEEEEEEEEEEAVEGRGMKALGEERALLCRVLEGVPECQDREYLQQCLRQNVVPGFGVLRRLCAGASRTPAVGTVLAIRGLAHHLHPHLYLSHLSLDYYWASALCHAGDVEQSLAILLHLHRHTHPHRHAHPLRSKKVCDITQLVLYRIVEEEEEEQVAKAVDFVDSIVTELGSLVPALSLWSATFTSPLFRVQQVSEWLVERHPGLVKLLGRRVEGLVERAAWGGDQSLLQRILHLSLLHNLSLHYPSATSALLQLQCDEGDLRGAEETIKFAQKMEVRLTPVALHRFLALLSRHRRPAPLALLALKYRPPPARPPIPPPPMPKYRF